MSSGLQKNKFAAKLICKHVQNIFIIYLSSEIIKFVLRLQEYAFEFCVANTKPTVAIYLNYFFSLNSFTFFWN
jgi:hypothetical protein